MKLSSTKSKNGIKAAILTMSFVQMATNGIAPILADIAKVFPEASTTDIQFLMTFPSLFIVGATLLSAWLCRYFSKKILVEYGLILVCISGILSFLFHGSLLLLFIWAGILGIGVGLVSALAISLISDYFDGEEKRSLLGIQTSAANLGSMLMTFLGGILAAYSWHWNYLIYFLALPGLILTICFIPKELVTKQGKRENAKVENFVWFYCVIAALFMLFFYIGPTNIAIMLQEEQLGNTVLAGIAATILLLGGALMGMLFGKLSGYIGKKTIPLGFLVLAFGYMIMYVSRNIALFYIGCLIVGASISMVMPQCMLQIAAKGSSAAVTIGMALAMSASNLGTFINPILTSVSNIVMKSNFAKDRILFTAGVTVMSAILLYLYLEQNKKRERCGKSEDRV
ncbi:MFS transporter [Clostridium saccharoperbutylacetonicum]